MNTSTQSISSPHTSTLRNYADILLLLSGIAVGSGIGLIFGKQVESIKFIGDIFLNLLFTAIIPLVFFTIASSVANLQTSSQLGKLFGIVAGVFLSTVLISALVMMAVMLMFPIDQDNSLRSMAAQALIDNPTNAAHSSGTSLTQVLTVNDFFELMARKNMLALILISLLVGFASLRAGEKGKVFAQFLDSTNEVMKQLLGLIMKTAPLGLGAYFAYQVGVFGPQLLGIYFHPLALYYLTCAVYFVVFFSLYAYFAGGQLGLRVFWKNNLTPAITAIGTCSSIATIPANLLAAEKMRIPEHIRNIVIPLGAPIHKDGSSMSSIIKLALLFAMFGQDFSAPQMFFAIMGITVIVSIVEGGIPNGGYIGEIFAITAFGFPMEQALPVAMVIGTLVDPIATLLNANGDLVSSMMVARVAEGKDWLRSRMKE
ncbi:dicarboxylate/amino acid:cation symporter [Undibacterium fentianense]|uniref:Dicarboxylate/amino acid:cation symporter n=1 Tax=Undibacterium fentianense TaxID=2828728 RepID=A0A941E707_9BURK|nr:dicarboxylate/amino acid:cation symporter [Undibacterium fentianense]MBR7799883.1 dicarboxylate/amino acid:cation symporter [Undibacterium fentianense]